MIKIDLLYKIARPAVLFSALYLSACNKSSDVEKPEFVDGVVTSEHFQNNLIDPDRYSFGIETETEIFHFECIGNYHAQRMDAVVKTGDRIRVRIDKYRKYKSNTLNLEDLVLVNGKKVNW